MLIVMFLPAVFRSTCAEFVFGVKTSIGPPVKKCFEPKESTVYVWPVPLSKKMLAPVV